jgi:purine-cytosine permease-like protein
MNFQAAMSAQQIDLEKAYLADAGNARAMQIAALAQEDVFSKRFVYMFAACWSIFSMVYATLVTFYTPTSPEGKGIAQTVLGFLLGTAVASIFSYFFGSTKGSADKTRLIAAK